MAFCDICGDTLREEEKDREIGGKQVCHDCLHDGLELLQDHIGEMEHEGRDRKEAKQHMQDADVEDTGETDDAEGTGDGSDEA